MSCADLMNRMLYFMQIFCTILISCDNTVVQLRGSEWGGGGGSGASSSTVTLCPSHDFPNMAVQGSSKIHRVKLSCQAIRNELPEHRL
jgi:hypothetical protein